MTQFITFVAAVLVFAVSQYILKLVIEPIQDLIGRVTNYLLRNQANLTNARRDEEMSRDAKKLAAELWTATSVIVAYDLTCWLRIFWIPSRSNVLEASHHLNLLSAADLKPQDGLNSIAAIGNALAVPTTYSPLPNKAMQTDRPPADR